MIFVPFDGNAQLGPMFLLFRHGLAVVTTRRQAALSWNRLFTGPRDRAAFSHVAIHAGSIYGVDHI
jgi:hypothetical protein